MFLKSKPPQTHEEFFTSVPQNTTRRNNKAHLRSSSPDLLNEYNCSPLSLAILGKHLYESISLWKCDQIIRFISGERDACVVLLNVSGYFLKTIF